MLTDPVLLFNKTPFLQFSVSNLVNDSKLKTTLCLDDITIFTYAVSRLLGIIARFAQSWTELFGLPILHLLFSPAGASW